MNMSSLFKTINFEELHLMQNFPLINDLNSGPPQKFQLLLNFSTCMFKFILYLFVLLKIHYALHIILMALFDFSVKICLDNLY